MSLKTKTDLIIALLYAGDQIIANNAPISGITRLEKMVFLACQKPVLALAESDQSCEETFNFQAYKMGPFSADVYDEVDFLKSLGLITDATVEDSTGSVSVESDFLIESKVLDKYQQSEAAFSADKDSTFQLTEKGEKYAKQLFGDLTDDQKRELASLKRTYNRMALKQFLRYVYTEHPEFTTKSEIKDYLGL